MKNDSRPVMVTVICTTYNHELYIRECLHGFVSQKTSFPFEVFAHDDASTDNTASIIKEYELKYPSIFRVVYETENQYSKKDGSFNRIMLDACRGKYMAFCEGDDYWTDPNKLQLQYDILESHPNVDICTHEVAVIRDGKIIGVKAPKKEECIIPIEEVIMGDGGFVGTNSIMMRSSVLKRYDFYKKMMLDYFMQIGGSINGGMYYINKRMSVYRSSAVGSWTQRVHADKQYEKEHDDMVKDTFELLNKETDYVFDSIIKEHYVKNKFTRLCSKPDRTIFKKQYRKFFLQLSNKEKMRVTLRYLRQLLFI